MPHVFSKALRESPGDEKVDPLGMPKENNNKKNKKSEKRNHGGEF